ncbi:shikimate dehydrogenase [Rubritalea tangerina]|uniref:Shikimate dehydrogenase (NADP(+)) n=1 Tax=Rubritalea tangerina TaxID=430798 RepID=A0ABW4Z7N9_9BACT
MQHTQMKHVYTLSDLRDPAFAQSAPNAKLAVIGHPIKHSASPQMHQAALDAAGIDIQYIRVEVEPHQVEACFAEMERLGFIGCNVTVPHKLEAMDLCHELTEDAKALGATNTILFKDGKRIGHNSDGPGLAQAIYEDFGKSLTELRVLILGAGGGAGRAIATQCAREGSPAIYLSNRTVEKLEPIAESLTNEYGAKLVCTLSNATEDLTTAAARVDLIINSTSLGLHFEDPLPLPESALASSQMVYDAIYNPPLTPLLAKAQELGASTSNGLSMLLHQGAISFAFWLGQSPDLAAMRRGLNY